MFEKFFWIFLIGTQIWATAFYMLLRHQLSGGESIILGFAVAVVIELLERKNFFVKKYKYFFRLVLPFILMFSALVLK